MALLGGGGTFKRWGLVGGPKIIRNELFKGIVGPWPFSFLLLFLGQEQMVLFHHTLLPGCVTTDPKQQGQSMMKENL
jgi:hypothetical protein